MKQNIDKKWSLQYTVPSMVYGSKKEAVKDLTSIGYEVKTIKKYIKGIEARGAYWDIYVRG
tara:strand:+ start:764 stop:946 length:183 start_codon:yes stop_codon:yes gene_type:complete